MLPKPLPELRAWRKIAARALDWIYPSACAVCGTGLTGGRALCEPCDLDLPRLAAPFCKTCGEAFEGRIDGEFACPNCHDLRFSFEFARPATVRDERTLEMVHRLKYGREIHLAKELGRLAHESFADSRLDPAREGGWPLVPVPLHRKRQQMRHFNQAEEISRILARHTGLPVLHGLHRTRSTETQTRLTRAQRMENLRGAFVLTKSGRRWITESPTGAILVDDVFTTGSTVDECAKILRRGGFKNVFVVTVMRG
jgi:ComF family protein